ncbi:UDP-N-acetylmuramyl pentapeptide phosphotransferase/UDP-N-acetylglucosamine-1-phosphate transferase [Tenacibaculum sp. 190524A02b]|uniref:MraY family glycosyltransferase n=1 Tax=Tenacibaculum vairaonense TaxID=3137860 RepID=UPI0032B122E8
MNYLIVFLVLAVLSVVYIKLADKLNIIDKPNHRSSHTTPTIRGGGILFYFAILIYFFSTSYNFPYLILGVSLIAIVSFIDDIITLSSSVRLPFQFLAIFLCMYQLELIHNNFVLLIPILIFGVGFINIYNFMDGINGITGLYSIIVLLGMYTINLKEDILDIELIIYPVLSLIVFGFYNFRKKARMFAGDIGSISIAVLIFFIGILLIKELKSPIIILLVAVYGADSILTIIYRKSIGERLTQPHRHHIYQKLVDKLKVSHLKVSLIYSILQFFINIIVFLNYKKDMVFQLSIILIISITLSTIYWNVFRKVERKHS